MAGVVPILFQIPDRTLFFENFYLAAKITMAKLTITRELLFSRKLRVIYLRLPVEFAIHSANKAIPEDDVAYGVFFFCRQIHFFIKTVLGSKIRAGVFNSSPSVCDIRFA